MGHSRWPMALEIPCWLRNKLCARLPISAARRGLVSSCELGWWEQILSALDLHNSLMFEEIARDHFEVEHMRTHHNRHASGSRLDNIVPSARSDGTANEDDVGHRISARQFADGVEQNNAG